MVPSSLPPDTVRLGDPGPAHTTPAASGVPADSAPHHPQSLSAQRGVLCDHTPPLAPSSCPRITAIVLSSLVGPAWPAAEAAFSRVQKQARGRGGGVSLMWPRGWVEGGSPLRRGLRGRRAACGSGLGRGYSIFVLKPAAKAPVSRSRMTPGRQETSSGQVCEAAREVRPRGAQGSDLCDLPEEFHRGRSQHLWAPLRAGSLQPCCARLARHRCSGWSRWWGGSEGSEDSDPDPGLNLLKRTQ